MAGGSSVRMGARVLQVQDCVCGQSGRETAFDVAKSSVVCQSLDITVTHGHVVAALLEGYRFRRTGNGSQETERTPRKGIGSWWKDGYYPPCEERLSEEEMRQGGQSRLQHCFERESATDAQTKNECWRLDGSLEEDVVGD